MHARIQLAHFIVRLKTTCKVVQLLHTTYVYFSFLSLSLFLFHCDYVKGYVSWSIGSDRCLVHKIFFQCDLRAVVGTFSLSLFHTFFLSYSHRNLLLPTKMHNTFSYSCVFMFVYVHNRYRKEMENKQSSSRIFSSKKRCMIINVAAPGVGLLPLQSRKNSNMKLLLGYPIPFTFRIHKTFLYITEEKNRSCDSSNQHLYCE